MLGKSIFRTLRLSGAAGELKTMFPIAGEK
jgi:hypothetical protein